ncbi:DUF177 domain-containing protein [Clostridium sp. 'deep sea']|uniref:YceD family protein n=1 Tax=Clostridium sp. 'deep sea' TaxID=2779445 RepID=UPI0018965502|nr:DUF177 domain-containing protein [Clostridium sp. 'deep sea']QOR36080.1 DUF177 domain-containing protein [Clostridium sp. 'deep sea']
MTTIVSLRLESGQSETHNMHIVLAEDGVKAKADTIVHVALEEFGIMISVSIDADIELVCSRCVETYTKNLKLEHSIILSQSEKGWEMDDDTLAMGVVNLAENNIDIKELVRQLLVESQDMRPLCSEECKGLCPVCGINLNNGSCNCDDKFQDPRWSKLRNISFTSKGEV